MTNRFSVNVTAAVALLLSSLVLKADSGKEFAVTPNQVALALRESGKQLNADQVRLLVTVHTRQPNAVLKVIRMESWQEGIEKAEVGCVDATACLPFFVLIESAESPAIAGQAAVKKRTTQVHPPEYDVHVGQVAILTFERNESRITMQVICVQNGDRGQTIRVASRDRKRFYQAEVVAPGVLRGSL